MSAGLLGSSGSAYAFGGGTNITGYFDVTQPPYNAVGDGVSNAQPGIQAAINAAISNGGGIVWIPPGVYKLNSGLTITDQITLCGAGWTTPHTLPPPNNSTGNGSWFSISSTSFTPITITGFGVVVRDLAFVHQQATSISSNWIPVDYPYAIEANGQDILLENIFLRNATRGIVIRGPVTGSERSGVGRVTLNRICGQVLTTGILIDNALDIIKINDVQFWPGWWSVADPVTYYMRHNPSCNAITSQRADSPFLTNIFVLGYRRAFYFTSSSGTFGGKTTGFFMSNCIADTCPTAVEVDAIGSSGMINGIYALGGQDSVSGIIVNAEGCILQCTNIRLTTFSGNCVRAIGQATRVTLENIWCDNWNWHQSPGVAFPGIDAVNNATVYIGASRIFTNQAAAGSPPYGGPASGSTGTIILDA